jgi:hypothetical protein
MIIGTHVGKIGGGRLGNSLWQIAFLESMNLKYGVDYLIPNWQYYKYFMYKFPQTEIIPQLELQVTEPFFNYTPEYWESLVDTFKDKTVGLRGWFQSYKYLQEYNEKIKEKLSFTHEFQNNLRERFKDVFTKPTIAISVRRGDYVGNVNYTLMNIEYYIGALYQNFSNYKDYNIVLFSDDLSYCRTHFECLDNVFFSDGLSDIEQLCLGTMMDNFIVSNSTFAFWMAYLGEKPYSKIVRPNYHFAGKLLEESDWSTYYPSHWIVYDHLDVEINKIDLHDVTFCIPCFYDHPDRNSNLMLNICMLQRLFKADILVGEMGGEQWKDIQGVNYVSFPEMKNFHRTKMLNEMFDSVNTSVIFNWDADVVVPPLQVLKSIELLRSGKADMVYPYDGRFARVQRNLFETIEKHLDIGCLGGIIFKGMRPQDARSVGGAMAWTKEKFIKGGMENENFISYAPEDVERFERFSRLGYKVEKVNGVLYHLDHFISVDSSEKNPFFESNWAELRKERDMTDQELLDYVYSWEWIKNKTNG